MNKVLDTPYFNIIYLFSHKINEYSYIIKYKNVTAYWGSDKEA